MPKKPNIAALAQEAVEGAEDTSGQVLRSITDTTGKLLQLEVEKIDPNPHQPRTYFDAEALQELAANIKQHGVLQPVVAYKDEETGRYRLIAGERRLRAAKLAGLPRIPANIRTSVNQAELAIIENLQRENLHPIELAESLQRLKDENGYGNEQLASLISKSVPTVSEFLALNELPQDIKEEYRTSDVRSLPKSLILSVVRAGSPEKVRDAWEAVRSGEVKTVRDARARKTTAKKRGRPKNFTFIRKRDDYAITLRFNRTNVDNEAIRAALLEEVERLT